MARFEAVLLDFANTVVQYDRPQLQAIHVALAEQLSQAVAPIGAATLGRAMDHVCLPPTLSEDKREYSPAEQRRRVLCEAYGRPFAIDDPAVVAAQTRNMVGAHAAGIATCHHRGMIAAQDLERSYAIYRPDFTIDHLAQLSEILALA